MTNSAWKLYVEASASVARQLAEPGQRVIEEPGIVGLAGSAARRNGRLLIIDDSALPTLRELGDPYATIVNVVPTATGCIRHMGEVGGYAPAEVIAMVARDLAELPDCDIDPELVVQPAVVDPKDGQAPLEQAAAACLRAQPPEADLPLDGFVSYLASIPNATLFGAVDSDGHVRATAGSTALGRDARVFFVSTDVAWRGRGVGTAMTCTALRAARDHGATRACLEASAAGERIYRRLGFEAVGPLMTFIKPVQ